MKIPDTTNWTINQRVEWLRNCTPRQWDAICKKCGVCCLAKIDLRNMGLHGVWYMRCACPHLNLENRQCRIFCDRLNIQHNCQAITLDVILRGELLPASCGYMEFVYGAAQIRAIPDWNGIKNADFTETPTPADILKNIIVGSNRWNLSH